MSLRWKSALFLVILLTAVGVIFVMQQQFALRSQLREARNSAVERQVALSRETLVQLSARQSTFAALLGAREDVRQALRGEAPLGKGFEHDWSLLQINTGLTLLRVLKQDGQPVKEDGTLTPGLPAANDAELLQAHRQALRSEQPQVYASCRGACLVYNWVPVNDHGRPIGTVLLASPVADTLLEFERVANADIGLLMHRPASERGRGDSLLALTGGLPARRIVSALGDDWQEQSVKGVVWQARLFDGVHYEIARWPVTVAGQMLPVDYLVITNVESFHQRLGSQLNSSVLSSIVVVVLSALLAVAVANLLIHRLQNATIAISLLGEKRYDDVMHLLPAYRRHWHFADEFDQVGRTVRQVARRLEQLERAGNEYQRQLSASFTALERERLFIRNLLDTAPVLILVHGQGMQVTLANDFAVRLCGFGEQRRRALSTSDFFPEGLLVESLGGALPVGEVIRQESYLRTASGEQRDIVWLHCAVPDSSTGELLSIGQDVTLLKAAHRERETLQNRLFQTQKMEAIGELAGGIAHDFNNILSGMMGYTGLAMERCVDDPESRLAHYLKEVYRGGERARDIVAQLLEFGRPEAGDMEPVDVAKLLHEVVRFIEPLLPHGMHISLMIDEVPLIDANPVHLQQMVMNLLINARDASGEHQDIHVSLRATAVPGACCASCRELLPALAGSRPWVELAVRDDGCGIAPEHLDRLFDPFFTTKEVGKGSGMGLSVVHGLVHKAGGHVLLQSDLQLGSRFALIFPPRADNQNKPDDQAS